MVRSFSEDFSVEWEDPADAGLTWVYDPMHFPKPLTPVNAEVLDRVYTRFMGGRTVYVNGFAFISGLSPRPPTPEIMARGAMDVWTKDFEPAIRAACERIRSGDYAAMSLEELAAAIDGILEEAVEAFGLTMILISGFMGPTLGLVQFLEGELGEEAPHAVGRLLQGFDNGTAAAGAGLGDLAEAAARYPAVAEALRTGRYDALDSLPGGSAFLADLKRYLADYGWRVESWGVIHLPTWAEDARTPLMLVGRYLADPERTPAAAIRRAVAQREEASREVAGRLPEAKLAEFNALMAGAQAHVAVSEGRALWQLITVGSLRVPLLALGEKLAARGGLESRDDIFYLTIEEIKGIGAGVAGPAPSQVASRRRGMERWSRLTPPPFLGAPPDPSQIPPEMAPIARLFFGLAAPEVRGREIKGQPASKGSARGRARVIHSLREADKLQPGEILVCTTTAPPWTPLFAIAAGVVTDSGGVLSHSAICAREYGIPCVVATQVATRVIPDGATISIDGGAGSVRIEG
jgi:pyruvate,water dikinase